MKRKITAVLLVVCILFFMAGMVGALASAYLERYTLQLVAKGSGLMRINAAVDGTKEMSGIGIMEIHIEEKNTSTASWHTYSILSGTDDPESFYTKNSWDHLQSVDFDGIPGHYYRVTTAHAYLNGVGSDTGTVTSTTVLCK